MRFGVQIAVGRGLLRAVDLAAALRCDCFQVHVGNPRVADLAVILETPDEKMDARNLRAIRRLVM